VRDDVIKATASRQEPFVYGSLGGDDVPLVPAPAVAAPAAAAANPQADIRRDYELALQVGNKSAFNAFLAQHPDGFYTSLARLQLEKLTAEDAHVAATAKAHEAEEQRARLAAAGAQKDAQAKADANAKAAEAAQLAAEKAKQVAQDQAADAERKRAEAAAVAAATPAPAALVASEKIAALNPTAPAPADLTKSVQSELRRVGCLTGEANGDWNASSQRSLSAFNRNAGTRLDVKTASVDTLDAIKQKPARVCPLVCEHGFKADGDNCVKIVCAEGSVLNDDNSCEKRRDRKPVATREKPEPRQASQPRQAPDARQAPQGRYAVDARPAAPGRYQSRDPSIGSHGQPLTGREREQGCNGYQAIMSGVCP
jgi:hypothetical protein